MAQAGMMKRFARRIPWLNLAQLSLLLLAINALITGLGGLVRGAETSAFIPAAFPAALLGWWLGHSRMRPWRALTGGGLLGLALLWARTAQLGAPLLRLTAALWRYMLQSMLALYGEEVLVERVPIQEAFQSILAQSGAVWMRVTAWAEAVAAGRGAGFNDPVVRVLLWSALLWGLALWAGWAVSRNKALVGLTPALGLLAAVTRYTAADISPLWQMLACTLGLVSLASLAALLRHWNGSRVDYSEMITGDTLAAAALVIPALVTLGWALSFISVNDMLEAYRRHQAQDNQVASSLGLEAARATAVPTPRGVAAYRPPGLPNMHLLNSGPELSKDVVFRVRTGEIAPVPAAQVDLVVPRHYWRSYSFDIYTGWGWASSRLADINYAAEQAVGEVPPGFSLLSQQFSLQHGDEGSLYWAGELYRSDQPFTAAWRTAPGQNYPQAVDPFRGADLYGAINSAAAYRVDGLVRETSIEELRAAGRDFPDFIQARYTGLPEKLPERVYALAREITSAAATPYDEARALEAYLRANYTYSLDVPLPPGNADVADTFLFELKTGYCDYYATAMAVMARSVGLPARLVMGFAEGSYDARAGEYVVTAADAHAWVEIYFPGIGWVEFEPTAGRPEIVRPDKAPVRAENAPAAGLQWDKMVRSLYSLPPVAREVFFGAGGLLALAGLFFLLEGWLLSRASPNAALRWMLRPVYRQGRRLAGNPTPGETPGEFAERLQRALKARDARLDVLVDIYLQGLFGPQPVTKDRLWVAIRAWRGLRWNLLWMPKKKSVKVKKPRKA